MSASIRGQLVDYIESELMFMRPDLGLDDQLDLLGEGILDSLGVLRLTAFLEQAFGLRLGTREIVSDNFRTLPCIVKLVESLQGEVEG